MKKYEVLYILANNLDEAAKEAQIAKYEAIVTNAGGEVTTTKWGVKKLAYPIDFKSEGSLPSELERIFGITEGIMRSIVIRHEDKKTEKKSEAAEA